MFVLRPRLPGLGALRSWAGTVWFLGPALGLGLRSGSSEDGAAGIITLFVALDVATGECGCLSVSARS